MQAETSYFYNMAFTVLFLIQFVALYSNSRAGQVEWLEVSKLAGPILFLNIALYFNEYVRDKIILLGFLFLCAHAGYGIVDGFSTQGFGSFISDDGRFMISSLGRGAGETAWAFSVFLVLLDYCVDRRHFKLKPALKLGLDLFSLAIIAYSQSRGAIVFVAAYYGIYKYKVVLRLLRNPLYAAIAVMVGVSILYLPSIEAMISRSSTGESFLTGREFIWAAHMDQLNRLSFENLMFGLNLESKIVDVPEIGYITADPHNIFLDIVNYYGIAGLLIMAVIYRTNVKFGGLRAKAVLIAFLLMGLLVSPFRYAATFYINVLILLVPTIRNMPPGTALARRSVYQQRPV